MFDSFPISGLGDRQKQRSAGKIAANPDILLEVY
jgi:hypothetical protein